MPTAARTMAASSPPGCAAAYARGRAHWARVAALPCVAAALAHFDPETRTRPRPKDRLDLVVWVSYMHGFCGAGPPREAWHELLRACVLARQPCEGGREEPLKLGVPEIAVLLAFAKCTEDVGEGTSDFTLVKSRVRPAVEGRAQQARAVGVLPAVRRMYDEFFFHVVTKGFIAAEKRQMHPDDAAPRGDDARPPSTTRERALCGVDDLVSARMKAWELVMREWLTLRLRGGSGAEEERVREFERARRDARVQLRNAFVSKVSVRMWRDAGAHDAAPAPKRMRDALHLPCAQASGCRMRSFGSAASFVTLPSSSLGSLPGFRDRAYGPADAGACARDAPARKPPRPVREVRAVPKRVDCANVELFYSEFEATLVSDRVERRLALTLPPRAPRAHLFRADAVVTILELHAPAGPTGQAGLEFLPDDVCHDLHHSRPFDMLPTAPAHCARGDFARSICLRLADADSPPARAYAPGARPAGGCRALQARLELLEVPGPRDALRAYRFTRFVGTRWVRIAHADDRCDALDPEHELVTDDTPDPIGSGRDGRTPARTPRSTANYLATGSLTACGLVDQRDDVVCFPVRVRVPRRLAPRAAADAPPIRARDEYRLGPQDEDDEPRPGADRMDVDDDELVDVDDEVRIDVIATGRFSYQLCSGVEMEILPANPHTNMLREAPVWRSRYV